MSKGNFEEILQTLKQQNANFVSQRDQAQINLNQLIGAAYAGEMMIKQYEDKLKQLACNEEDLTPEPQL